MSHALDRELEARRIRRRRRILRAVIYLTMMAAAVGWCWLAGNALSDGLHARGDSELAQAGALMVVAFVLVVRRRWS